MRPNPLLLLSLAAAVCLPGCRSRTPEAPLVSATNSLLECAVKDLLGGSTSVLRLAGPGACPGHFDIRPSQVRRLRHCRVLLRLDFQKSLDAKLAGVSKDGLRIAEIHLPGGLCEPPSYLAACEQTAHALVEAKLLDRDRADRRLAAIAKRVEEISSRCRRKVEALRDEPVIASAHQEAFCRWLGLRPVAVFAGADSAGVAQVDRAVRQGERAGVKLIIANRPEGRRVADALAERLGARVVVFGNFPALASGHDSFDELVEANVDALREAAGR